MKSFPKKYDSSELRNRSKQYRQKNSLDAESSTVFSTNTLPSFKKLSYRDFFLIYLKDFFNKRTFLESGQNWEKYEQLFFILGDHLESTSSSYQFFAKKNQSLSQIWSNKLERHVLSSTKKYVKANHKILDTYLSGDHKVYLPDLDLYTYIIDVFHSLWDKWKIMKETKIWYWSFNLQTSISLEKISRKEEKVPCYVLKYFIWAKWDAIYVPVEWDIDTCCGDVALLVHPKDKRYNKYIWKKVIIPLCNRQIPIIWYEGVNIAVNNWIQRICPCSDEVSIQLAKKFWLPMDIYSFDKQWLYTQYIHEPAFIWKERSKYYNNIVEFIDDIGNIAEVEERISLVPYLDQINERLTPYKIDQLIIDLKEEKQKIIDDFFNGNISYPVFNDKISEFVEDNDDFFQEKNLEDVGDEASIDGEECDEQYRVINERKQKIIDELGEFLPDSLVCNSQVQFWWKVPLISDSANNLRFFDTENDCLTWKQEPYQLCFDFVLLSLVRMWVIHPRNTYWDTNQYKVCEYDKFYKILSENQEKIEYFIQQLSRITWEKTEYNLFINFVESLVENDKSSIKDLSNLVKNCKFLDHKWIWLLLNVNWIVSDMIDLDFIQLCIPCYLDTKWIKIKNETVFIEGEKDRIFKEILVQQLLLWRLLSDNLLEEHYCAESEFLWDKELTKFQLEQSQWNSFMLYWENPVRLNLLVNRAFDQKEIILNNIFLKQIRNAIRLCIQKDFLPKDIENCLSNQPYEFDDYDIIVLNKLNELLVEREKVDSYEEYIKVFASFKESMQNVFFSWYLEILKVRPTVNAQFVCSYFFNFLLTILYPLVPEFVEALQYVSEKNFLNPINSVDINKTTDYNTNMIYNTFIKIKQLKLENDIKQHKTCNIFIKSTPTICDVFAKNEQIFKNYFHISEINYLRLHEANPLWYEIFSDELITIGIQHGDYIDSKEKKSVETLEADIKNMEDKLNLLRQRIPMLPEWEQRLKAEKEYAETKEEMEKLTIKYSLLNSK